MVLQIRIGKFSFGIFAAKEKQDEIVEEERDEIVEALEKMLFHS